MKSDSSTTYTPIINVTGSPHTCIHTYIHQSFMSVHSCLTVHPSVHSFIVWFDLVVHLFVLNLIRRPHTHVHNTHTHIYIYTQTPKVYKSRCASATEWPQSSRRNSDKKYDKEYGQWSRERERGVGWGLYIIPIKFSPFSLSEEIAPYASRYWY